MTSPFDDVKKGERFSGETSFLGLIFCVLYFLCLCWTSFGIFSICGHIFDVCVVDMCFLLLYIL